MIVPSQKYETQALDFKSRLWSHGCLALEGVHSYARTISSKSFEKVDVESDVDYRTPAANPRQAGKGTHSLGLRDCRPLEDLIPEVAGVTGSRERSCLMTTTS